MCTHKTSLGGIQVKVVEDPFKVAAIPGVIVVRDPYPDTRTAHVGTNGFPQKYVPG